MERMLGPRHHPQKSSSFSASSPRDEKLRESDRNLSLGAIKLEEKRDNKEADGVDVPILEEEEDGETREEGEGELGEGEGKEKDAVIKELEEGRDNAEEVSSDLGSLCEEIDRFLDGFRDDEVQPRDTVEIPDSVERFVVLVEKEVIKFEAGESDWCNDKDEPSLILDAIDRISKLTAAFTALSSDHKYCEAMNRAGSILHHAMSFLEDEFYSILDEPRAKQECANASNSKSTKRPPSFGRSHESSDRCGLPAAAEPNAAIESLSTYPPETVERLRSIAHAMISAGYEAECCQVFAIARRNAFDAGLSELGMEKISIDEVQRMGWESLEGEIATWIKAVRLAADVTLRRECDLCGAVFSTGRAELELGRGLFRGLAGAAVVQLLNFAEAVAMAKRSAEKLFKVLDMYETLRDVIPKLEGLFARNEEKEEEGEEQEEEVVDLVSEISSTWSRLGEAAVAIFCDLESSIEADNSKTTVPGGTVHPLTRYVMNYLKYACEYKKTLEEVFQEHRRSEKPSSYNDESEQGKDIIKNNGSSSSNSSSSYGYYSAIAMNNEEQSPLAAQLVAMMDLLHGNLEAKAKLYKDPALSSIFLMNNGRYIVQKIRGSAEINQLLGETWCRRKSSELRQYHKNYQRETWARVLACFKDEGLQVNGRVQKAVLKERFKAFNAMFEEIHKTQSTWVVSDEQLQSELRVSVSAVVVPAYRSFLGRFQQHLDAGRQMEKYIKYGPEDLEACIDDLFDGNPSSSMVRRRT